MADTKEKAERAGSDPDHSTGAFPDVDALSDEMKRLAKAARRWVDEYPLLSFGTIVGAGYLVGRILRR
jgi:hypothetical protein